MKIKEITYRSRRDYKATMFCEFCGAEGVDNGGYDDRNYHDNVIPRMKCSKCGESTLSKGGTVDFTETKYPEGMQI